MSKTISGISDKSELRSDAYHLSPFTYSGDFLRLKGMDIDSYNHIRSGGTGFIEMPRGLIAVWGKEAVQFLDGLLTNDMKTLEDGGQILAAFPNAQGRLLAVVRVLGQGDSFLFETEEATREKVFNNLFRFTYAGDFFVEDLSEQYRYFEIFGGASNADEPSLTVGLLTQESVPPVLPDGVIDKSVPPALAGGMVFTSKSTSDLFATVDSADSFIETRRAEGAVNISATIYETLRIENGIPLYGVDMDENTIVPELGLDGLISYNKGCYIGQEIIARIHFRGHVAKQLTGLVLSESRQVGIATGFSAGSELTTADGKNAGRITSVTYSPKLNKAIALAYVRYDYLADGTELACDNEKVCVKNLPFIDTFL